MIRRRWLPMTLGLAFLLAACGAEGTDEPTDEPTQAPVPEDTEVDVSDDVAHDDPEIVDGIEVAVADAAAHAGVDRSDIEVERAEAVTWPDGALGCPEPDMSYTQALVDGFRIVLSVEGEVVAYHAARGSEPFRCEDPSDPVDG